MKKFEILQGGSPYGVENSQNISGGNTGKKRWYEFLCLFAAVKMAFGTFEKSYLGMGASAASKLGIPELAIT